MKTEYIKLFQQKFNYSGQILPGSYSAALKNRLAKAIMLIDAMERFGNPTIPYIAAWRPESNHIWYEFCGKQFHEILAGSSAELANAFREQIVSRSLYRQQGNPSTIVKLSRDKEQLSRLRPALRRTVMRAGEEEAVYKIEVNGTPVWLKDVAKIEIFAEDNIILSFGSLIDVSSEMALEEALEKAQQELKSHKKNLESLVEKRTKQLHKSQLEVVSRLTQALVYRDDETGLHCKRLSDYCSVIGSAMGLSKGSLWALRETVPMHDVGKVGIADAILLKNGPLSPAEFDTIKTHCQLGADLLQGGNSQLLQVAQVIALTHHERWDGSGYPHGLQKREIPLAGRLTALCDVFDALTSPRSYKETWGFERATDEIGRMRNVHFDPQLVDLFMENLPKIRRIYSETVPENEKYGGMRPAHKGSAIGG
ncbi:MAG: HD domain-containing phosphohydrolase [Thermodesulfobacteriota bacterium]